MGKKKKSAASAGTEPRTVTQCQRRIERLDRELLELANARVELAQKLTELKAGKLAASELESDETCLERIEGHNAGPLPASAVRAMFRELLSGTRRLLRQDRVCYLGPEFSYSHLAAVQHFGTSVEFIPVATISTVFDALNRGQAEFGLVPLENSTDGRVTDTLDMFARTPVGICGEVQLRIHHHLLGKCARSKIQAVYSKPQALSQCRAWLARHLPEARTIETASTTAAARLAVDEPGAAAIASRQAGVNYGLNFIAESIQDNPHNVTRFAVIGGSPPPRSGNDKTALMFELSHQPGALADVMAIFKRNRLNMTWIESFPMPETPSEYLFFIEFQGHCDDLRARRAVTSLEKKTVRLEILGSYPAREPVD